MKVFYLAHIVLLTVMFTLMLVGLTPSKWYVLWLILSLFIVNVGKLFESPKE